MLTVAFYTAPNIIFNYIVETLQHWKLQCNIVEALQEHTSVTFYEKCHNNIPEILETNICIRVAV